ncbi:NAD(FAD)-utilizing dehydrogenase [Allostella vacuolata]|nr:NAD(FAD)-utilizing dehydrogenase [Stella vacuolata]
MRRGPGGTVAIVGGGPAGLMAAEIASAAGARVTVWERMPSVGRKLLMAGRGGLNLTHSEPAEPFLARYGAAAGRLAPALAAFPPERLRAWADGLGQATFVGSSGRVFPAAMKASPLLRAWLARLAGQGVRIATRRQWQGWDASGRLVFASPDGSIERVAAAATILALGGASWPRLGSDGGWVATLAGRGVAVTPLVSANCGFQVAWSEEFRDRFAGTPLKPAAFAHAGRSLRGEAMVTAYGIEGGAVYALSAGLRDRIAAAGEAVLEVDLRPDLAVVELAKRLAAVSGAPSMATRLRKGAGLAPVAAALLREAGGELPRDPAALAARIKSVPLRLVAPQPLARAISTAGGIALDEVDAQFMLRRLPGTFVAGEMLDWEAPTGGYLLQATFATAAAAAEGALAHLEIRQARP